MSKQESVGLDQLSDLPVVGSSHNSHACAPTQCFTTHNRSTVVKPDLANDFHTVLLYAQVTDVVCTLLSLCKGRSQCKKVGLYLGRVSQCRLCWCLQRCEACGSGLCRLEWYQETGLAPILPWPEMPRSSWRPSVHAASAALTAL